MAQINPGRPDLYDPSASLTNNPCLGPQCLSQHEMFAIIVKLLMDYNSINADANQLMNAVRRFRGINKVEGLQFMINSFGTDALSGVTAESVACLNCLTDQQLWEAFLYLWKLTVTPIVT